MTIKIMAVVVALSSATPALAQPIGHDADHTGHLGAGVMPFDLNRSLHVFSPSSTGGVQIVISLDGDAAQIDLIRAHLAEEAAAFARGDYADPTAIHGTAMPGLAALQASGGRVQVSFEPMPRGAQLDFEAGDPVLVAAVHRWFEAQVRDHGGDAIMRHL